MRLIDADRLANLLENNLQSFEEMISEHGKGLAHGTRIALKQVEEQPTIAPESTQPQWIPVAERLPGPFERVIVCRDDGKVEQGYKDVGDWWKVYGTRTKQVTHWMPFPGAPDQEGAV